MSLLLWAMPNQQHQHQRLQSLIFIYFSKRLCVEYNFIFLPHTKHSMLLLFLALVNQHLRVYDELRSWLSLYDFFSRNCFRCNQVFAFVFKIVVFVCTPSNKTPMKFEMVPFYSMYLRHKMLDKVGSKTPNNNVSNSIQRTWQNKLACLHPLLLTHYKYTLFIYMC